MTPERLLKDYQAFFFDFDGVLADSVEVKTRAFARLFESYGPEVMNQVVDHHRKHGGMTRIEKFQHYYQEFLGLPLDDEGLANLCRQFARLVVDEVVTAPEIDGSVEFLKKWSSLKPCFVISATPEEEIREIVRRRGLNRYFKEVLGAPVTKKNNLKRLLKAYSLQPERCLFFGDAESDYQAARAYGVVFLGILPGPDAPLLRIEPELNWVKDFTEIERSVYPGFTY